MVKNDSVSFFDSNGLRTDGRRPDELRPIELKVGILENATGSAFIQQGENRILVGVYGPREIHPKHLAFPNRATLRCRYHMAPFSVEDRKRPAPSRREWEISKVIREALEPVIFTEYYPRTGIEIYIEVLEANGGTRCSGITAASLALADAGIPMRDLVVACASGKIGGKIVLDLNDFEDKNGEADLPVAISSQSGKILLLQMDGKLSPSEFHEALHLAIEGCRQIYEMQKNALKVSYPLIEESDEVAEED
ncbi:exosome complex exonuclease Rrp41 [Candidatus Bathyarchaeota archaeon]|nr:exosome complex exonuclease Rrp41 [Candidatus Bathyarchaeota archaeon]